MPLYPKQMLATKAFPAPMELTKALLLGPGGSAGGCGNGQGDSCSIHLFVNGSGLRCAPDLQEINAVQDLKAKKAVFGLTSLLKSFIGLINGDMDDWWTDPQSPTPQHIMDALTMVANDKVVARSTGTADFYLGLQRLAVCTHFKHQAEAVELLQRAKQQYISHNLGHAIFQASLASKTAAQPKEMKDASTLTGEVPG